MNKEEAEIKNANLVRQLVDARECFCAGLGTRRVKLMLNRIGKTNDIGMLFRSVLEIEDCNIQAKRYRGKYKDNYYEKKHRLIEELAKTCNEMNIVYGISKVDNPSTTHVIYFELPNCRQISFHFSPKKAKDYPVYGKPWDGEINSIIEKLEEALLKTFHDEIEKELRKYRLIDGEPVETN